WYGDVEYWVRPGKGPRVKESGPLATRHPVTRQSRARRMKRMPRTASRARPGGYRDTTPRYSDADIEPLIRALIAVRDGKMKSELDVPAEGAVAEAAGILEEIRQNGLELASGLHRVRREIGREGHLRGRLTPGALRGTWATAVEDANAIIDKLT